MQDDDIRGAVRQFRGLWIPVEVLQDPRLNLTEKVLWADINSYTSPTMSYFKSRERIAEDFGVSERSITRAIKTLIATGWIAVIANDGRKRHFHAVQPRQCVSADATEWHGREDKVAPEPRQIVPHSNTVREQVSKTTESSVPTLESVQEYFIENGSSEGPAFFDYYSAANWQRKGGVKISDWKAAARNWIRNAPKFRKQRGGFDGGNFDPQAHYDFITTGQGG